MARNVDVETVVPLAAWIRERPWNEPRVRWFLFFGVFPLALRMIYANRMGSIDRAAWALGIYFALMWLVLLRQFMRPERVDAWLDAQIAAFTVLPGILLVFILTKLPIVGALYRGAQSDMLLARWIGSVFGVGLVEEGVKALPVYLFLYRTEHECKPLTYAYFGVVSGLAFGVAEAVQYSYQYAVGLQHGQINLPDYIVVQVLRWVTLPLLHACFCGITSYFIGLARLRPRAALELIVTGYFIAAVLHGTYDTFQGWMGVAVAVFTLLVFASYVRSADDISRGLTETDR